MNSKIFLFVLQEKERNLSLSAQEMRKFLALPIEEKATHAARALAKLKNELVGELEEEGEEESEKKKSLKQIRSKAAFPKQTRSTHKKTDSPNSKSIIEAGCNMSSLSFSLMTKRSEILKMEKAVAKEERKLKQFEKLIERDNQKFEEFLRENERKSVEARALFEREEKSKQEKNAVIKKLTAEMRTIQSELEKYEDALTDYLKYKDFLFRLSPPEWQDEKKSKDSKAKTSSEKITDQTLACVLSVIGCKLHWQVKVGQIYFCLLWSNRILNMFNITQIYNDNRYFRKKTCSPDSDSLEDKPELYFTDPQQLLDLMSELTEQNLSLIQNSARVGEALEKLRQTVDTTRRKIEEEKIALQIKELNQKLDKEKAREISTTKYFVICLIPSALKYLHQKLDQKILCKILCFCSGKSTYFLDEMLDALDEKVTEVYSACVENRITDLSTLQKVAKIESRVFSLLQSLEGMPVERLAAVKKVKDSEKRSRMREEKLMEQREKQKERMKRYLERSLADSKKISGKKLMPRCMPAVKKVEVADVDNKPAEDDINDYLFGLD
uniref:DUF4200 domain-containing protein n=1 Tax=Poecilia formosa TaxID=48698 RepID=A0A096MHI9_POEFO